VEALAEVNAYGGLAVQSLRDKGYVIIPVTASIHHWTGSPANDKEIADTVAGLGAGGSRVGWWHPATKDDWLFVWYGGHLLRSGTHAIWHVGQTLTVNSHLVGSGGMTKMTELAMPPAPPDAHEKQVLLADAKRR
jgi:hypothetical protein